jgi:hypothetical protein
MMRSLCVWLAAATLSVSACGGSSSNSSGGDSGAGGSTTGGGGSGTSGAGGGSPGATGGAGGGARGGAGGGGGGGFRDAATDIPPSDVTYEVPPVEASVSFDAAAMTVGEVVCERVFSCCTSDERAKNPLFSSQLGCSVAVTSLLGSIAAAPEESIRKGRVTYDASALAGCLRRYMMQTCDQARATGGLSAFRMCKFTTPLVAIGGACQQHFECVNGWCSGVSGMIEGKCTAKAADGQPCPSGVAEECASDFCNPATKICQAAPVTGLCAALF